MLSENYLVALFTAVGEGYLPQVKCMFPLKNGLTVNITLDLYLL